MAILEIVTYPDPILAKRCPVVTEFNDDLKRLANDMLETMYAAPGVGLAAPQVGRLERMWVIDVSPQDSERHPLVMVNPEILERRGELVWEEGCLSLPGLFEDVVRAQNVRVRAQDLDGDQFEVEATDLLAVAIQHETDHLDGVVFPERLSRLKRKFALKRYLRERERAAAEAQASS